MSQSKLEAMYELYADGMHLQSLEEIRKIISHFYHDSNGSTRKPSFVNLADHIEFRFVKKMLYASDFKWPSIFGICGTIVFLFHLITDGIRTFTIGSLHGDMILMLLVSVCLFFSSYPFLVRSFDCNMQEQPPVSSYFLRLVKLTSIFILASLLSVSVFYFLGFTKITFY